MRGAGGLFGDASGLCLALREYVPKPFRLLIHRMLMPLKDCCPNGAHRTYSTRAQRTEGLRANDIFARLRGAGGWGCSSFGRHNRLLMRPIDCIEHQPAKLRNTEFK